MLEIGLLMGSLALQGLASFLGVKLSLDPVVTPQERTRYKAGFVFILIFGAVITLGQQWINSQTQDSLEQQLESLRKGVATVQEQTKEPPTVTVNVPPIQVLTAPAASGPLPTLRLTSNEWFQGFNDTTWVTMPGYRARIDWRDMASIDAFAELEIWARECGEGASAKARLFDQTNETSAVESDWIKPCDGPVFRRLKLPRGQRIHTYVLQVMSQSYNGMAAAIGEIVLERR